MKQRKLGSWMASLPVGLFFVLAALSKLDDPTPVSRLLSQLPVSAGLSHAARNILQGALIGAEIYVGVALLARRSIQIALPTGIVLLAFFSLAVAPFYEGLGGDCGCVWLWIPFAPKTGIGLILRNLCFALLLCLSAWLNGSGGSRERRLFLWGVSAYLVFAGLAVSLWFGLLGWAPPRMDEAASLTPEPNNESSATLESSPLIVGSTSTEPGRRDDGVDLNGGGEVSQFRDVLVVDGLSKQPLVAAALRPARDILVYAIESGSGIFSQQKPAEHETGAAGLTSVPKFLLTKDLVGTATGYEPARLNVGDEPLYLELEPSRGPLLVVRDSLGRPLPAAHVALRSCDYWEWGRAGSCGEYVELGLSSDDGEFRLPSRLPGLCTLLVQTDSGAIGRIDLTGGEEPFMLELRERGPIRGVVRGNDGHRNWMVYATCTKPELAVPLLAPVAEDGKFVLPAAGKGLSYRIVVGQRTSHGFVAFSGNVDVVAPANGVELAIVEFFSLSGEFHSKQPGREIRRPAVLRSSSTLDVLVGPETPNMRKMGESRWIWSGVPLPVSGEAYLWVVAAGHMPKMAGKHVISPGGSIELGRLELSPVVPWNVEVTENPGGAPVPQADVTFLPDDATSMGMTAYVQRAQTGSAGRCVLDQPSAAGELIVRKVGWADARLRVEKEGDSLLETERVSLTRSAHIQLTVVGVSGESVPAASIRWTHAVSGTGKDVELDRGGFGTFAVPGGDVQLIYAPELVRRRVGSLTSQARSRRAGETTSVFVDGLLPGELRRVELTVPVVAKWQVQLESHDGRLLAEHRILAIPGEGLSLDDIANFNAVSAPFAVSDSDGIARLAHVPTGVNTLFIEGPARQRRWREVIVVSAEQALTTVRLGHRDVFVRVKDGAGDPLSGVSIEVEIVWGGRRFIRVFDPATGEGDKGARLGPVRMTGTTDAEGVTLFKDLPVGCKLVFSSAEPSRFSTLAPVTLFPGGREPSVAMALKTGASLTIRDPNYGGQETVVWLQSEAGLRSLELDTRGEACFYGLVPGRWSVQVVPVDWKTEIYLKPGEERLEVVPTK